MSAAFRLACIQTSSGNDMADNIAAASSLVREARAAGGLWGAAFGGDNRRAGCVAALARYAGIALHAAPARRTDLPP